MTPRVLTALPLIPGLTMLVFACGGTRVQHIRPPDSVADEVSPPPDSDHRYYDGKIGFLVPAGVGVRKSAPADFHLIDFSHEGHVVLTAYLGGFPNFPTPACDRAERRPIQVGKFSGFEASCLEANPSSGLLREIVAQVQQKEWPPIVHFMQPNLERELGDRIIESLEVHAE